MGYTTTFEGSFKFSRPLTATEVAAVNQFASERHEEAGFPGYYCQWVVAQPEYIVGSGGIASFPEQALVWDQSEKFYEYVPWLVYLIDRFFDPWGVKLSGEVTWEGEESGDLGKIVLANSKLSLLRGTVTYG